MVFISFNGHSEVRVIALRKFEIFIGKDTVVLNQATVDVLSPVCVIGFPNVLHILILVHYS